jgi:cytochrome c5
MRFDGVFTMLRNLLPVVFLLSVATMPLEARAAAPFELKPVKVDLPESDRMFPAGPGSDAINNNCHACHSAGMVLNQPALSKQAWAAEVNKMINNFKAPVAPEDVATIVEYLTALKGTK